ncbi:hypothetical protein DID88_006643 [Monilinia fructigena]|uniref:Uncharacterized protein n=1 Tax=Monilinia fructigena TaxID=38457 RepID=A0A395IIB2_9HELO|nr:hypothetical protein DID88_006643 [Monilinia fructigena]
MDNASPQSSKEGHTPRGLTRSRKPWEPIESKRHQPSRIGKNRNIDTPGLMRRLQEDYKPKNISSGPSSSSPLPDRGFFPTEGPSSPLGQRGIEKRTSPLKRRLELPSSPTRNFESAALPPSPMRPSTSESDYGSDDGLDEIGGMILTAIESQTQAPPAASLSRPLPPAQKYESPSKSKAYSTHKLPNLSKSHSTLKAVDYESDEFGEGLDDDDFDAAISEGESDDEYGDDIDDLDFAAAEMAATQSLKQSANSLMPSMEKVRAIQRYLVIMIDDDQFEGSNGKLQPEKPGALVKAGNAIMWLCVSVIFSMLRSTFGHQCMVERQYRCYSQITMRDGKEQRTLTAPLEVKTGKNPSVANRAQTALYNLLISDRYDVEIAYGILYYMETSETIRIPAIRHELRHMIMQRNELACFVREKNAQLPPMLKKESMCGRCYAKNTCFIYHKLADDGNGETKRTRVLLYGLSNNCGEPIVISDEKGHFALAKGYVTNVRTKRITVAVDRRLHNARIRQPGFDEVNNQVFASIMEVAAEGSTPADSLGKIVEDPILYRLDKDEFSNGLAAVRNNLIQIMTEGPFGSREIRGLVVDLNAPRFKPHSTQYTLKDRSCINVDQRRAIEKVMSAQDYALVLGMPGTGKTTNYCTYYSSSCFAGKNLPNSQSNPKKPWKKSEVSGMIRQSSPPAVLASIIRYSTNVHSTTASWMKLLRLHCPFCVGPIRLAHTFILVGDHNQLPPLVKDEEARKGGLDISLFKYLSEAHPQSVVYLEHQYRMNADVMALSNTLIYNGRLKCGSDSVATRKIIIPEMDALKAHHHTPSSILHSTQKSICLEPKRGRCWLRDLLDPDVTVAFVDTDGLGDAARESEKGNRTVNDVEAKIVTQLVTSLISTGVDPAEIGVMTHYRSQLALLKDGLRSANGVEMHTADRFQGRDKEVIVLSLVRSNETGNIGES